MDADDRPALALWRRLDAPGHDACRLAPHAGGWRIDGTAVFREEGVLARLDYQVECDARWLTRHGHVRGWLDARLVEYTIVRTAGGTWTMNGAAVLVPEGLPDLDLGFTPATNTLQLRRLGLARGQSADAPVAWLDVAAGTLDVLQQRYERRSDDTYWYESPRFAYQALLEIASSGFVRLYPGLWELEP